MKNGILVLIAALTCAFASDASARTWTSRTGTLKVEAEYVETTGTMVRLRKTNGEIITLPLGVLSDADREYIKAMPHGAARSSAPPVRESAAKADRKAGSLATTLVDDSKYDCATLDDDHVHLERGLDPAVQLKMLEKALQSQQLDDATRLRYTEDFAKLALCVAPEYGKGTLAIDEVLWIALLEKGHALCGQKPIVFVVRALTERYINRHEYADALRVVGPFHRKNPDFNIVAAFYEWSTRQLPSAPALRPSGRAARSVHEPVVPPRRPLERAPYVQLPSDFAPIVVDVHFCVITANPAAHAKATLDQLREEVQILNRAAGAVDGKKTIGFRTIDNKQLVHFRFKSASFYKDVKPLRDVCPVVGGGDASPHDSKIFAAFDQCQHALVRDRRAVNFYVFDNTKGGESWGDERAAAGIWPIVLIDYARLDNHGGNPEPHEMGHAFGLQHVGIAAATARTETNIMSSSGPGFSDHQGTRTIGFTEAQTAIVVYHAKKAAANFRKPIEEKRFGRLAGKVSYHHKYPEDTMRGRPVRDAEVVATHGTQTWRTLTDDRGQYSLKDLPGGDFTVTVSKKIRHPRTGKDCVLRQTRTVAIGSGESFQSFTLGEEFTEWRRAPKE